MIAYCGLRHFYIHHFTPSRPGSFYILTYNEDVWDFSPELKQYGVQIKPNIVCQLEKPILTEPIAPDDFWPFAQIWHDFSKQYTEELEPEYPHSWYLRFRRLGILEQFIADLEIFLEKENWGAIWGAGTGKLVAKLAAHNPRPGGSFVPQQRTEDFLKQIPLRRLPLPESKQLEKLGLKTIGELAELSLTELTAQFGQRAKVLQQLGRGQDLIPFQAQAAGDLRWELDCTALKGFLRPLTPRELKPYLKQGAHQLARILQEQNKIAGVLKLEVISAEQAFLKTQRRFKTPTNEAGVLKRAVESILPQKSLAKITLAAGALEKAPPTQLNMFLEPAAPQLAAGLPAQIGVKLSRRDRFLIMQEESFSK
ncbi:MAG: hypothetical protein GX335_05660 [Firmicutes bacterium]|nr:hypothetical protein [Bacillota bacterium]